MNLPFAGDGRFWACAFLGLGLPVCLALAWAALAGETLSAFDAFGRLATMAAFLILGLAALALATRGRAALFALLCWPASLAAASGSDGPVLALAALAAALLSPRPMTGRRGLARRAGAVVAIALAVLARPACAPLVGMLLVPFPPRGRLARYGRDRLPLAALALLPALLPASLWAQHAAGAGGGPMPLPIPLPWSLYGLWAAALLVPALALRRGPLPPRAERLWLSGCALLGLWLMVAAQALAPAGGLGGLQIRDLLPLAPMGILAFARGRIGTAAALRWPALLPVLAAAIDAVALPLIALRP
ncbi:hypothetical protein CIW48_16205 [Methylobacterium sp. P1-11]|uniref:hypothetical protein n=1 Tax=Methylobacterium sp. P1-11 TaxID=2024616 RepID=UPI0011EC5671|nr:hypothetical protein [Methylobacterium sp. P1-11]KAA0122972.1 hypothetical protein CIW48_16205 [Methylobacterium sp. P1-11]